MRRPWQISRRALLRGAGVGIGLPMLQAMLPGLKQASAAGSAPKRLVFFVFEGGTPETTGFLTNRGRPGCFRPKSTGANFETTPILKPLIDMGLKNDILVVSNMHNHIGKQDYSNPKYAGLDHNRAAAALLTGISPSYADGPNTLAGISADQLAAKSLGTPVPSLYLSNPFQAEAKVQQLSWSSTTTRFPPIFKPSLAFQEIFGDRTLDPAAQKKSLAYRKSVLHSAKGDIDSLMKKLGKDDKETLDEYLTGISSLESRLSATVNCNGGTAPVDPAVNRASYYDYRIDLPTHNRLMSDIIVKAFACDVTRVVVVHLKTHRLYPGSIYGGNRATEYAVWHNDIEHGEEGGQNGAQAGNKADIAKRMDMYVSGCAALVEQFGYLVKQLKETPDGDGSGSILDNSILACLSEISYGSGHSMTNLPLIVAGKGGGVVSPGRHIAVTAQPIANLWLTMLRAAGVKGAGGAELAKFGNSTGAVSLTV